MPTLQLSDGSTIEAPEGIGEDAATAAIQQGESLISQGYQKHAADTGAPVTAGGKIYSATATYPNTYVGGAMAWLDHNAGGNWMNRNIADPLNRLTGGQPTESGTAGGVAPAAMRSATGAIAGLPDLALSGANVAKHYIAPGLGTRYDAPLLGESFRSEIGAPELPANAPLWQRALEAGAAGTGGAKFLAGEAPTVGRVLRNVALGATGVEGSQIGGELGGEAGSYIGGLAGGGGLPVGRMAAGFIGSRFAHPNAPAIAQAAGELGFTPSFRALANPTGQRVAAWLGGVPFAGGPLERANEAVRTGIEGARNTAAEGIAGQPMPPGGANVGTIGGELTAGAQEAVPRIKAAQGAEWNPINAAMQGRKVDLVPVLEALQKRFQDAPTTPENEAVINKALAGTLSRAVPGGTEEAPTLNVPWSMAKDLRTGLGYQLGRGDVQVPGGMVADIKGDVSGAMGRAAAEAGQGPQFEQATRNYAAQRELLDKLYPISGQPLGASGRFTEVPGEATAFRTIGSNLQSPTAMAPLAANLGPSWNRAAGQYVSTLGGTGPSFRPEHFARDWGAIDQGVQAHLAGTGPEAEVLRNAATVASNFSTPVSRHGLQSSLGTGVAIAELLKHIPGLAAAPLTYAAARGLESGPMKQAMVSGASPEIAASLYRAAPRLGAIESQEPNERLRLGPAANAWWNQAR